MDIKEKVKEYLLNECDEESRKLFEEDENIDILGGNILDSLGIVRFLVFVEDEFNVDLIDSSIEMEDFSDLNRLAQLISEKMIQNL